MRDLFGANRLSVDVKDALYVESLHGCLEVLAQVLWDPRSIQSSQDKYTVTYYTSGE